MEVKRKPNLNQNWGFVFLRRYQFLGKRSSGVELWIVIPAVVGSIPIAYPFSVVDNRLGE